MQKLQLHGEACLPVMNLFVKLKFWHQQFVTTEIVLTQVQHKSDCWLNKNSKHASVYQQPLTRTLDSWLAVFS